MDIAVFVVTSILFVAIGFFLGRLHQIVVTRNFILEIQMKELDEEEKTNG